MVQCEWLGGGGVNLKCETREVSSFEDNAKEVVEIELKYL
jgi:hypothetical protein